VSDNTNNNGYSVSSTSKSKSNTEEAITDHGSGESSNIFNYDLSVRRRVALHAVEGVGCDISSTTTKSPSRKSKYRRHGSIIRDGISLSSDGTVASTLSLLSTVASNSHCNNIKTLESHDREDEKDDCEGVDDSNDEFCIVETKSLLNKDCDSNRLKRNHSSTFHPLELTSGKKDDLEGKSATLPAGRNSDATSNNSIFMHLGSIFNLVNNVAGAGILTLPAGQANGAGTGYFPAVIIAVGLGLLSSMTFINIGQSCDLLQEYDFKVCVYN
jgi:hypothetical protein